MRLIHKGIRPQYDVEVLDFKRKIYIEEFPDGSYRIWTKKQLNSGCNGVVRTKIAPMLMGCHFCPTCNEWFSESQWEITSERERSTV